MPSPLALNVLDPHSLLSSFVPIGVAVVLFAETGPLVGFGAQVGYLVGRRVGTPLFARTQRQRLIEGRVRTFTVWQVVGGLLWSLGITWAGYWLGSSISNVDHYLLPIIALVVVLSLMPIAVEITRTRRRTQPTPVAIGATENEGPPG